jgi:hypothetical protein
MSARNVKVLEPICWIVAAIVEIVLGGGFVLMNKKSF